jgi:hypothetical protein
MLQYLLLEMRQKLFVTMAECSHEFSCRSRTLVWRNLGHFFVYWLHTYVLVLLWHCFRILYVLILLAKSECVTAQMKSLDNI